MREPAEVVGCFLGGLADDRHIQAAADHASDVSERQALVGDPMIPGSRGTLLEHEPVEMSRIEPVHGGPAVEPFAEIGRSALLTRKTDEERDEAVIAAPCTDGGRQAARTPLREAIAKAASSDGMRYAAGELDRARPPRFRGDSA
jgi:hypothetical protein